jgi:hypothetical protein
LISWEGWRHRKNFPTFCQQLGQPIRLLLAYTDTDYEERIYEIGPAPDFDKSDWLRVKFNIGLDFPNLPYYIDGNHGRNLHPETGRDFRPS